MAIIRRPFTGNTDIISFQRSLLISEFYAWNRNKWNQDNRRETSVALLLILSFIFPYIWFIFYSFVLRLPSGEGHTCDLSLT